MVSQGLLKHPIWSLVIVLKYIITIIIIYSSLQSPRYLLVNFLFRGVTYFYGGVQDLCQFVTGEGESKIIKNSVTYYFMVMDGP